MSFQCKGYVRTDNSGFDKRLLQILDSFYSRQTLLPVEKHSENTIEVLTSIRPESTLDNLSDAFLEQMAWALLSRPDDDLLIQPLYVTLDSDVNGIMDHPPEGVVQKIIETGFVAVSRKTGLLNRITQVLADSKVKTAVFLHAALAAEEVWSSASLPIGIRGDGQKRLLSLIKKKVPLSWKFRLRQIFQGVKQMAGRNDLIFRNMDDQGLARKKTWTSVNPVIKIMSRPRHIQNRIPVLIAMHWLELGGAEKFAMDLIKNLPKEKYAVYVTTDVPSPNTWKMELKDYAQEIWELPVLLPDSLAAVFYKEFIESRKIQLLHIHHGAKAYQALFYLRRFFPRLIVLDSLHIIEMPPNTGGYPEYVGRDLSPLIDHHHVISDLLKRFLVQRWQVPEEKISRIYLNVDPDCFNPEIISKRFIRSQFDIPDETVLIGFIGRFVHQKQPLLFVEVAKNLQDRIQREKKNEKVFFVMVGSGPLKGGIEKRIHRYGLTPRVFIHPEVIDTRPVYRDIDLLVMPSENEGLALVSYESMAMKVPVVFSDVGAQSELQEPRYLVSPEDGDQVSAFADKIMPLIRDVDKLRQSGDALRSYILEHHRASDTIEAIERLYTRLLE